LAPGSLGSDTGGAIPISLPPFGVTGGKPTHGRGGRGGGVPPPLAVGPRGAVAPPPPRRAVVAGAGARHGPGAPTPRGSPAPDYTTALTGDVKGLRIGLLRAHFTDVAAPEVRAAVEAAARQLEGAGAVVDEVNLTHVQHVGPTSTAIIASEALAYHAGWMRTR